MARFHDHAHRNGIIAQADAEIRFSESYIADLINIFKEKPEVIGVTGRVDYESSPGDYMLFKKLFSYGELKLLYKVLAALLYRKEEDEGGVIPPEGTNIPSFDGSNMASRAFEAAEVGGVPKLPGAEDPEFGFRLARIGKTEEVFDLQTITLRRFSPRTTTGRGQVHIEVTESIKEVGEILVDSPEEIEITEKLRTEMVRAIDAHKIKPEYLAQIFTVHGQALLTEDQLKSLSEKMQKFEGMSGREMLLAIRTDKQTPALSKDIRARMTEILGQVPLKEAIKKLIEIFCIDPVVKAKYESTREEMIQKENNLMRKKREMLQSLLNIIFENNRENLDNSALMNIILQQKENIGIPDDDVKFLEEESAVLGIMLEAIKESKTKEQAMDAIVDIFRDSLSPLTENALRLQEIELEAMFESRRGTE